jgi:hypothetical protein
MYNKLCKNDPILIYLFFDTLSGSKYTQTPANLYTLRNVSIGKI